MVTALDISEMTTMTTNSYPWLISKIDAFRILISLLQARRKQYHLEPAPHQLDMTQLSSDQEWCMTHNMCM